MEWLLLLGLLAGGGYAAYKKFTAWHPPGEQSYDDLHWETAFGNARYAKINDYKPGLPATGVFLGQHQNVAWNVGVPLKDQKKWGKTINYGGELGNRIYTEPESNTLLVAPAGSGKGRNVIINTLLETSGVSVFTIDPKGENCAVTVRERLRMGQKVHVLNPWSLHGIPSKSVNPLDLLNPEDPAVVSNATFLTDLMMMPGQEENFWDTSAKTFIRGLLLYIAAHEPQEKRNLIRFYDLLNEDPSNPSEEKTPSLLERMFKSPKCNGVIHAAAAGLESMADRTRGDILATARAHCDFLNDPTVRASLTRSDFSFKDLKQHLTTIYVIIPAYELDTQGRWLRLMVGMAITAMQRGEPFTHRCLFLLDEFAALGRLEAIRQGVALHRGYGIDYCLVVQDLNQLQELYKTGWQTIISNCRYKYFKAISDNVTAEYVSKLLGHRTVWTQSETPNPEAPMWAPLQKQFSAGQRTKVGMPLERPEQLLTFNQDQGIVVRTGANPMLAKICPYDQDEWNSKKADRNPYHTKNYKFPEDVARDLKEGKVYPRPEKLVKGGTVSLG